VRKIAVKSSPIQALQLIVIDPVCALAECCYRWLNVVLKLVMYKRWQKWAICQLWVRKVLYILLVIY